jgi:hypothetical protein
MSPAYMDLPTSMAGPTAPTTDPAVPHRHNPRLSTQHSPRKPHTLPVGFNITALF